MGISHTAALRGALLATFASIAACSTISGENALRVRGLILPSPGFASRVIVSPDTVAAGAIFTVSVNSFGSGSCTRADGATVTVVGALATISVWDRQQTGGDCTVDLRAFPRDVPLRILIAGRATIRVEGRAGPRATNGADSLAVVEKQIVVR